MVRLTSMLASVRDSRGLSKSSGVNPYLSTRRASKEAEANASDSVQPLFTVLAARARIRRRRAVRFSMFWSLQMKKLSGESVIYESHGNQCQPASHKQQE